MLTEAIAVMWRRRHQPLVAVALVARGTVARSLGRRLLARSDFTSLRAVAADDLLCVLGDEPELPWVDGVTYLGRDASEPSLLMPTTLAPSVPIALLAQAIARRHPELVPPLACLPGPGLVVPLGGARAIDGHALREWLG